MPTQLRLYTINRGHLGHFAEEWKARVLPLRRAHGFEIERAWTIEASNQFAWVISYDGPESWEKMGPRAGRPRNAPIMTRASAAR